MKRILAFVITMALVLTFASCNSTTPVDESKVESIAETSTVSDTESTVSDDESEQSETESEATSEPEQSQAESVDTESQGEESEGEKTIPEYISNFISTAAIGTGLRATDATSIRLTKVNDKADYGDVAIFTYDYYLDHPTFNGNASDYALFVAEYNHEIFGTVITTKKAVGEYDGSDVAIPDDGFVVLAHKTQDAMIQKLNKCGAETKLFVAGVQTVDVGYAINETETPITIDGIVDDEWQFYKIDTIDENNPLWTYSSFEKDNYYATAEYYVTFDKDYLYLAVVVKSPYHYCPVTEANANDMWKYECIQVKLSIEDPKGEYLTEHYDHVIDNKANNDGYVRAYGFAANNQNETCYYENSPKNKIFKGNAVCLRNAQNQTTTYEIAFAWSEFEDFDITAVDNIGLTFSINSTNEADIGKGTWRNLVLRDGGGVIGRNDWAKIPSVSLIFLQ